MKQTATPTELARPSLPVAGIGTGWWSLAAFSMIIPWLSQPPLAWWPLATIAAVPLLLAVKAPSVTRKQYWVLYLAACIYWALTLQGLRLANPLIYPCWIALAFYLGIYPIAWVVVVRRTTAIGIPLLLSAPIAWVGMECVRNYLLTGISAVMLGHAWADVPTLIQIADLGGSYALSWVVMLVNTAIALIVQWNMRRRKEVGSERFPYISCLIATTVMLLTIGYGTMRLNEPTEPSGMTIALIGRNEVVEYDQDRERELELFDAYAKESIRTFEQTEKTIDAVVWPESMFTGQIPWMVNEPSSIQEAGALARQWGLNAQEAQAMTAEHRARFQFRASSLQSYLAQHNGDDRVRPELIGGCGVVHDGLTTKFYSGMVHVGADGQVLNWYGKMHLVMFGEYIPLVKHIPWVRDWIPKNLGLTQGETPQRFEVGGFTLCPNICIETAVERVAINHFRVLRQDAERGLPDAIVTVTNDGWFDDSSVVQHHKRCAQLVAVACRRPILSSANNGPTVWIDSSGRVVQELPQGSNGFVIANPRLDRRTSLVIRIGDWPARWCAACFVALLIGGHRLRRPIMGKASDAR